MKVPVFCGKDCGGGACPMLAVVEGGRVVRTLPNPAGGPWILPCSRGLALADEHNSPLRLSTPLLRTGPRGSGSYRPIAWDEALAIAAERLGEIAARSGPGSVLALAGAGSIGALHSTSALTRRFLSLAGGFTDLGGSYSNGAARFVLPYLLGPEWRVSGFDPATIRHAKMIVLWGANVMEARLGSEIPARLLEARRRGATIVVIDPRRSGTVERVATRHLACRPGTDAALMLALLEVLVSEGLVDRSAIDERAQGFSQLVDYIQGAQDGLRRGPEWAEAITGVAAAETRALARTWASTKPVMLLPGYSVQRVRGGEEPYRLALALQLATGNFGLLGGSTGSLNNRLPTPRVGSIDPLPAPGRPELPILHWPDAILEGRAGGFPTDLRAALVAGSNWLGQGADALKSARALDALEFSLCLELFPTPTALRCDLILPVASACEKEDIGIPWLGNWLSYKPRLLPPAGLARNDYDIYAELAGRLGFEAAFTEGRNEAAWIDRFLADSEIADPEAFKESGFYLAPDQERVGLADFARDPRARPLGTPSGRVELASPAWARDFGGSAIPTWVERDPDPAHPLLLVSPKVAHRTHSQGGDPATTARSGGHFAELHPSDAAARGICEGDEVRLFNASGSARAPCRLVEGLMRGVVCLPEGRWLAGEEGNYEDSGSANLLLSTLDHGPARAISIHGTRVEVELATGGSGALRSRRIPDPAAS